MIKRSKDIEEWVVLGSGGPKSDVDLVVAEVGV